MSITVPDAPVAANLSATDPLRPIVVRAHARKRARRGTDAERQAARFMVWDERRAYRAAVYRELRSELAAALNAPAGLIPTPDRVGIILTAYEARLI